MSYARWRKCDFQVHTPRDPNWKGARPFGLNESIPESDSAATIDHLETARSEWARTFIQKCVDKNLSAVAITDHHEMFMYDYINKELAKIKADRPDIDLWVFPGMELTTLGGSQCIIIFDPALPEEERSMAMARLGIVTTTLNKDQSHGPTVTQLRSSYSELHSLLEGVEALHGRFIILPNISQGGNHTVLSDGKHIDFKKMPYVGGYLDNGQTIDTLSSKNRVRTSGTDPKWSDRFVYPLPTSDARSDDYAQLGNNNTWIKLATPTAEAIRQAFLAYQSRIAIQPPTIPSLYVTKVAVTGSSILEDIDIALSPELNSIIGGRGSGKSSFQEYLAFGLGRSCHDTERKDYSGCDRMRDLVNETLLAKGGTVTVELIQDGARFKIERGPNTTYQPLITYPDNSTQTIPTRELRSLFPTVVYSQGELAELGKKAGEKTQLSDLLQFVDSDYKAEDSDLRQAVELQKRVVSQSVQNQVEYWELRSLLREKGIKRDSIRQRADALEKTLPKLDKEDQALVDYFGKASEFETKRVQASKQVESILAELISLKSEFSTERELGSELSSDTGKFETAYKSFFSVFTTEIKEIVERLSAHKVEAEKAARKWAEKLETARKNRDDALKKLSEHSSATAQIIKLREEVTHISTEIGDIETEIETLGDPSVAKNSSIQELRSAVEVRAKKTGEWAKEIERLTNGKIKAVVEPFKNTTELKESLDAVSSKTGSKEGKRISELTDALGTSSMWEVSAQLRSECAALIYWKLIGSAEKEDPPKCDLLFRIIGDTDKIRGSLQELADAQRLSALATCTPIPEITLSYRDGTREISFEKASEGQRAAALLFMLLEQPGGPLLVDQPEGDLDNRIISDLATKLHETKSKRQIIFASHNANVVVNGSSELVGQLGVSSNGKREFESSGAIDDHRIRQLITSTMEGGEKAFRDRKEKYGF